MILQFKTESGDAVTTDISRVCCIARPPTSLGRTIGKYAVWIEGFTQAIAVKEEDFNNIEVAYRYYLEIKDKH